MNKYILFFSLFLILLIPGCEKSEITNSTEKDYPYYLEGYLEAGRYALLHISRNTDIFKSQYDFFNYGLAIADSAARFYSDQNVHALLLKDGVVVDSLAGPYNDGSEYWRLYSYEDSVPQYRWWYLKGRLHKIEAGGNYRMVVKIGSNPEMVASCRVPETVKIQHIDSVMNTDFFGFEQNNGHTYWYPSCYKITFKDPVGVNFYKLECYSIRKNQGSGFRWPLSGWMNCPFFECPLFENNSSYGWVLDPFFSDKLFDSHQESVVVKPQFDGDSLFCIKLVSISEGYYRRLKSMYLFEKNLSNMYASPVQVYSNFTNATGFLAGRNVSSDTLTFPLAYIDTLPGNVYGKKSKWFKK